MENKFFEALKPGENPFAEFLYLEFKRTGDPKVMQVLLEEQEEHLLLKPLLHENDRER